MTRQQLKERHATISESVVGDLAIPLGAQAIVLFAHSTDRSRCSSKNHFIATLLNNNGIATLLVDLLSKEEKKIDEETKHLRYNIGLLVERFQAVTSWLAQQPDTRDLKLGYFVSSTGAAAALVAAARLGAPKAIVTCGGRLDLVDESTLHQIKAPMLLIVGGNDLHAIAINKTALELLSNAKAKELVSIPDATYTLEEDDKLEQVAQIAADWFECYLLRIGKEFHNKHVKITRTRLLSPLWSRHGFQIKFKDRFAAGEILASTLSRYKNKNNQDRDSITVIGIARGGIIVAAPIAEKLNANLDIIAPRKLRSPHNSENAIGAIMHDGSVYLDNSTLETQHDISREYIDMEKLNKKKEMEHRLSLYRPHTREYKIRDRTVILVDDGIATGATVIAAARWIRKQEPKRLIIAAPVAPKQVVKRLKNEADKIEIIRNPSNFKTIEQFYHEFEAVSDHQIMEIMKHHLSS